MNIKSMAIISVIIITAILFCGCTKTAAPAASIPTIDSTSDTTDVVFYWGFSGETFSIDINIDRSVYGGFSKMPRVNNFSEYMQNTTDDEILKTLSGDLTNTAASREWDELTTVNCALSFVQHLNYSPDGDIAGYTDFPKYPVETLVEQGGDCEDTSILFAHIMASMGYKTTVIGLLEFNHMMVGIGVTEDFVDNWDESYHGFQIKTYELDNNLYAVCETTGIGFMVGQFPYEDLLLYNPTGDFNNISWDLFELSGDKSLN